MIPTIQRKFTRQHAQTIPPVAITTKSYDLQLPPEERYQRHFALWSFWQDELVEGLGESVKKATRAVEESVAELQILQSLLAPEKRQILATHIAQLERLQEALVKGTVSGTALYRWRSDVERQQRMIRSEFAWKHVQESMVAPALPPAVSPPASVE